MYALTIPAPVPVPVLPGRTGPKNAICREKPKIEKLQDILGGPDPAEDDGWAEVVEKKSVVATGGKQVSDLM